MSQRPKVPRTPPADLWLLARDVVGLSQPIWRIHRTQGEHVIGWNAFRTFGPLSSARYDPHPEPVGVHPGWGVSYAATELATSIAEVFQTTRQVNVVTGAPYATAWVPTRPLRLLDLRTDWALRNGAAAALTSAARQTCRAWSRAIRQTWPDLDGLLAPSTMTGRPLIVLYEPAASTTPEHPDFSEPLAAPVVWSALARIATDIGYSM